MNSSLERKLFVVPSESVGEKISYHNDENKLRLPVLQETVRRLESEHNWRFHGSRW